MHGGAQGRLPLFFCPLGYSRAGALPSIHRWSAGECSHFPSTRALQLHAELPSFQHGGSVRGWRCQNSLWGVLWRSWGRAPSMPRETADRDSSQPPQEAPWLSRQQRDPRTALMIHGKRRGVRSRSPRSSALVAQALGKVRGGNPTKSWPWFLPPLPGSWQELCDTGGTGMCPSSSSVPSPSPACVGVCFLRSAAFAS